MRRALLMAFVLAVGCAKPPAPDASGAAAPVVSGADSAGTGSLGSGSPGSDPPGSGPREADAQAAYRIDAACESIRQGWAKAKALAEVAGGDAGKALAEVVDGLDAAGQGLADHTEPPPAGKAWTDAERKAAVQAATDALGELRDAGDILDGLAQDAPPAHEATLTAIRSAVDEAEDAVTEAIEDYGAEPPPEG